MLLCTVGTSLFRPNLESLLKAQDAGTLADDLRPLAAAYRARDWTALAAALLDWPAGERLCGAEINSVASMVARGHVPPDVGLTFFHSATDDGRATAAVLRDYYRARGHSPVEAVEIADLQDADPHRFRTRGLRHLAQELCRAVRARTAAACAVNATGGYKAQIAVAVLLGQALGIPVYYMHERFREIIAFPPLPVAFDFEVWMRASGLLFDLERADGVVPAEDYGDDWDVRYDSLVERVSIDGRDYLELSAAGQIFHETFRERFRCARDQVLPPPAPPQRKRPPAFKSDEGHLLRHRDVLERFLGRLTDEVPPVVQCVTTYFNPDLPQRGRFRDSRGHVEGVYSDGTWTVKFRVETTAETDGQRAAVVAALNEWLSDRS